MGNKAKPAKPAEETTTAVDLDSLTYGEMESMEEVLGFLPDNEEAMNDFPRSKVLVALAYAKAKNDNPEITLDDVRKAKVGTYISPEVVADPTDGPSEGGTE